jgi:hypothetical protein
MSSPNPADKEFAREVLLALCQGNANPQGIRYINPTDLVNLSFAIAKEYREACSKTP